MSFRILYVENRDDDWHEIEDAVAQHNESLQQDELTVERAKDAGQVTTKLREAPFDVVLADVYFNSPDGTEDAESRIRDIINNVASWRERDSGARPLPVIAYTGVEEGLDECLGVKDDLYDIWDKNTARGDYAVWRLSRLAGDLAHDRPDSRLVDLVLRMESGASWHEHVVALAENYGAGWTEMDQINRSGSSIKTIGAAVGARKEVAELWDSIAEWEMLARATSPSSRGHARHLINVFWMGYLLVNHDLLAPIFEASWKHLRARRPRMDAASDLSAREFFSGAWFLAGLLHDCAGAVQGTARVARLQSSLVESFTGEQAAVKLGENWLGESLVDGCYETIRAFDEPLAKALRVAFDASLAADRPDHGIVASGAIQGRITSGAASCMAGEAGRATALHNLFAELDESAQRLVTWQQEPLACLLLLCDQIQTWDRQRGDESLQGEDSPSRAELHEMEVSEEASGTPLVTMRINYIAPAHVTRSREVYQRVKMALINTLEERPAETLERIHGDWPFRLDVTCALSGEPLSAGLLRLPRG